MPADSGLRRSARRVVTVCAVLLGLALAVATAPVWVPVTAIVDLLARGRTALLRCGAFLFWYLLCEALGLLAVLATAPGRLAGAATFRRLNARLQERWGRALFLGARWSFGIRLETRDAGVASRGPLLLLMRHASLVDTLVPTLAVAAPYGIDLRYVLKSELLWDPCLDIVGHRMGHWFSQRGGGDTEREIEGVRKLAAGLGPNDGVMIYPEGTRFSEAKRARILARLEAAGDAERLERARALSHVLPPRLGGTLALLDAAPGADVVVCAHAGLEAANRFRDLWQGRIRGAVLQARFWRIPRAEVPDGELARAEWLQTWWQRVDAWVGEHAR